MESEEILLIPNNKKTINIYNLFHNEENWKKWKDSSSKDDLPPDFYNDEKTIMMDIMRVDDHAYENEKGKIINPTNKRENELMKELSNKNPFLKKAAEEGRLFINPDSGLRGIDDHNYIFYIKNMERVIKKHIDKIPLYLKNHPDYKIIFTIMDESSLYALDEYNNINGFPVKVGEKYFVKPHLWWDDSNFLKHFEGSQVDYLIWLTPYKNFDMRNEQMPRSTIIDLKKLKYSKLKQYPIDKMYSMEI